MYKAAFAAAPMADMRGGRQEPNISFEPEPVELSARVHVKFVL